MTDDFDASDDTFFRALFDLVPELPEALKALVGRVESFDGKSPQTLLHEIKADLSALESAPSLTKPETAELVLSKLKATDVRTKAERATRAVARIAKRDAATDTRYSLLLKLMRTADERIPLISIIVSMRHGDPQAGLAPMCYAGNLLAQAESEVGEPRATAALRALVATAEYLYRPYLITIWQLSCFANDQLPGTPPDFGDLVKAAHRRLSGYPGLVELDAGWMRNSAVHQTPEYDPADDTITMQDRNKAASKVKVDDLLAMVRRMYTISGNTITRVAQLYMFRDVFLETGLLDRLAVYISSYVLEGEGNAASAQKDVTDFAQALVAPLQAWFASHTKS